MTSPVTSSAPSSAPPATLAPTERHLFEAWCEASGLVAVSLLPGTPTYASQALERSWNAWQARAALSETPLTPERTSLPFVSAQFIEMHGVINGLEWISVEDRLPECGTPVFAVILGKRQQPPRVAMATHWRLGKGYSGTDPEWMEGSNAFISARVTHWMPLALPSV